MNNLSNLRYLSNHWLYFTGVEKLKFLQELKGLCIRNVICYIIVEVEHMNELCILGLTNLKDVRDAQEACNAILCDKRKLTFLSLNWNHVEHDITDPDLDERVLDNLQSHNYLNKRHETLHGCQVFHLDEQGPFFNHSRCFPSSDFYALITCQK